MKLITFSLWGQNPKYLIGAIRNAKLAQEIYPDWTCRFYTALSVPFPVLSQLEEMPNTQIFKKNDFGDWRGMFWRFEPASENDVEVMISRDTDSRLNYREKEAVNEWIESDKGFHIMRDHPYHKFPVLGGMWGVKNGVLPDMKKMIGEFSQQNEYGTDYKFFAEKIVPHIEKNVMIHDEFFGGKNFPTKRKNYQFVGQVYDENEKTVEEHLDALKQYLK